MRLAIALLVIAAGVVLCVFEPALAPVWAGAAGTLAVLATLAGAKVGPPPLPPRVAASPPLPPTLEPGILEALPEPILIVDANRVTTANAAARTLLGTHIVGEDVRLAVRHPVAAEQFGRTDPAGVVELAGLGGGAQRVRMEVVMLAAGRWLVHLSDRSTSHAAERARVDFVANASHELRTPLAAILGFVETLSDDHAGGDPGVRARFLAVTMKEARRMQRLIDDLISLSRIEAEKFAPLHARVALGLLARQVAAEQSDSFNATRDGLVVAIAADLSDIMGDAAHLSQVIHNLLDNAFRYGRAPVTLSVGQERGQVRLAVTDTGDGIAAEHVPRLTERFYRVDPSRSRSVGGTGLGLAIVKHIVERHRGRFEISSKPGVGTTATITLPVAPPVPAVVIKPSSN